MSTIFGMANMSASDYQFARQADQSLLYGATQEYLAMANQSRLDAWSFFVQPEITTDHTERVKGVMTGYMQKRTKHGRSDDVRPSGSYDVAYPVYDFGDAFEYNDVDFAYMSPQEFQDYIDGVIARSNNTYRFEVLTRLFKNTTTTFTDDQWGSLTVQPLAITSDGVVYPPLQGAAAEATAQHYLESGYTVANISDTNNPIKTNADLLISTFGRRTGGIPIATLIDTASRSYIEALSDFVPVQPTGVRSGDAADWSTIPANVPGEIIGHTNSSWVSVWDFIPATYMVSVPLEEARPLVERNDLAGTGLDGGLRLVAQETNFPINYDQWRWRFGIGTRNRRGAVVMEVAAGGSYTIPTVV